MQCVLLRDAVRFDCEAGGLVAALLAASKSEVPAPHGSVSMIARSTWLDQVRDVLHGLACASVARQWRVHAERRGAQTDGHCRTTKASALALRLMLKRKGDFFWFTHKHGEFCWLETNANRACFFNPYSRAL